MPLAKQRAEIPLGVGVETKSQDFAGDQAHVQQSENTVFFETGAARKRNGETQVGTTLVRPQRALIGRKGQLATVGYDGLRYLHEGQLVPLTGQDGGTTQAIRPIPCLARSRKVRGDLGQIAHAPLGAMALDRIVYTWTTLAIPNQITVRIETLTGEIVRPDLQMGSLNSATADRPLSLVANGTRAFVWARDLSDDVVYVSIDLAANTIGARTTYFAGQAYAYDSRPDPQSADHCYFIFYEHATQTYRLHRVYMPGGTTAQSVTITPDTPPVLGTDARARLHVSSTNQVWVFTGEGPIGVNWHVRIYTQTLSPVLTDHSVLFDVYGLGAITDIAVCEHYTRAGVGDPTTALILAQHDRDASETPANSSASVLDTYSYTSTGTLSGGGNGPPLATRIPNCRIAGQPFSLVHGSARIPFFPVRYWRDVEDAHKPTFAAGTQDFEFHTSMLITPHYGEQGSNPDWNVVARYGTDLEGLGARPMALSETKFALAHAATSNAGGELAGSSLYITSWDFDPPNVPSQDLDGTWFGLAHQSIWSGSELLDGAMAAAPGPPVLTGADNVGDDYRYKVVWEWEADDGALVRSHESPPSAIVNDTLATDGVLVHVEMPPAPAANHWTNKRHFVSIYRTLAGLVEPYRLVARRNDLDPSSLSLPAKVGSWRFPDNMPDSELLGAVPLYTTGGRLNAEPPPPFLDFCRVGNRMWAIDGQDDHRVWPSLVIEEQTAPEWNAILALRLPSALVAVEELAGRPLLLGETGVWTVYGDGPNNAGSGDIHQPAQVSSSYGAISTATVARTPLGVVFASRRGMYLVSPDMQCAPWGLEVDAVLREAVITRVLHVEPDHQVRIYTEGGTACVYDLVAGQWSTWSDLGTLDVLDVQGQLYRLEAGDGNQRVWHQGESALDPRPAVWTETTTPTEIGDWMDITRVPNHTLWAAAKNGRVGRRLIGGDWTTTLLTGHELTGVAAAYGGNPPSQFVIVVGWDGYAAGSTGSLSFSALPTGVTTSFAGIATDSRDDGVGLPAFLAVYELESATALATVGFGGFFWFPVSLPSAITATNVFFFGSRIREVQTSWYWVILRADGGVTWTSGHSAFTGWVHAPGPSGTYLSGAVVSGGWLYVCGRNGLLARTQSPGGTAEPEWELLTSGTTETLSALDATDEGLLVAVGDIGTILYSENGITWVAAETPNGEDDTLLCVAYDGVRSWSALGYTFSDNRMLALQSVHGLENHGTLVVETKWIKVGEPSKWGQARVWGATLLARQLGTHGLQIEVSYDYEREYPDVYTFSSQHIDELVDHDQAYELKIMPRRQKCAAIRFRIRELTPGEYGTGVQLVSLVLDVGTRPGGAARVPQPRTR